MSRSIRITNMLDQDIVVICAERNSWSAVDYLADGAMLAFGFTELKAALTGAFSLPEVLSSFSTLKGAAIAIRQIWKGVNAAQKTLDAAETLWERIFDGNYTIAPGETIDVFTESLLKKYFSVGGVAAMGGVSTMTMMIMTKDKELGMNALSDIPETWVVDVHGAHKSSDNSTWPWDGEVHTTSRVSMAGATSAPAADNHLGWRDPSGKIKIMPLVNGFWAPVQDLGENSADGPGIATINGELWVAWKTDNSSLWVGSGILGQGFGGGQLSAGPIRAGPKLIEYNRRVYVFWVDTSQQIHYSSRPSDLSSGWTAPAAIPGMGSSIGPCGAVYNGKLYLAWVGSGGDQTNWYTSFDGQTFAPQQRIPGTGSTIGPDMAVFGGKLYAAWRGAGNDEGLWWSHYDGTAWAAQSPLPSFGSQIGPALVADPDGIVLWAAWRGAAVDDVIWYSFYDGTRWNDQQPVYAYTL